jgi:cytochrome c-type biogenesis protein CcsB
MTTSTLASRPLGGPSSGSVFSRRSPFDWAYALILLAGAGYAFQSYHGSMNSYEIGILLAAVPALIALGWFWGPLRPLVLGVGAATLTAIAMYLQTTDNFGADLSAAEKRFFLKYLLSSQSAILWMGMLVFMSTLAYWGGFFAGKASNALQRFGSQLAWGAVFMALLGTMVRWFESHQIGPDIGHIPVSNLYEVFVLFIWITTVFLLYYEQRYAHREGIRSLGAFVMLVASSAVGFLIWYTLARDAHEIQPLVPALQSWWMKIHVPANFVGYGTFSLAAMVSLAYLLKTTPARTLWISLVAVPGAVLVLMGLFLASNLSAETTQSVLKGARMVAGCMVFFAFAIAVRDKLNLRTPSAEVLDDVMYKSIAVGFAFFTIATILGAFWAAEAWGGYWSWDPKETWALIVWLNYAAWLHMRMMKGLRGAMAAWWALAGLLVTTFAFLGVNMFLSGLHSYGQL